MPYKKTGADKFFFSLFMGKRQERDDILSVADKVIEDYIYSKSRFIQNACAPKKRGILHLVIPGAICAVIIFLLLN